MRRRHHNVPKGQFMGLRNSYTIIISKYRAKINTSLLSDIFIHLLKISIKPIRYIEKINKALKYIILYDIMTRIKSERRKNVYARKQKTDSDG